jgi:divalent metal cation (Fe/Co/Zn/Cd) transporter
VQLHGIRSRRSGQFVYIEIFLEFDQQRLMGDIQKTIDLITSSLEQKIEGSQVLVVSTTSPIST